MAAESRYSKDVLAPGWQKAHLKKTRNVTMELGMVVEDPPSGFVGEIMGWENGLVILEDRHLKRRTFPVGPGFWLDGQPVSLCIPPRTGRARVTHTASGSRIGEKEAAKVALPSRIYVEGRHDAQLVEKIWGDDLRHVGVAVEYLGGIDDLVNIVAQFKPQKGRRLGVLVDHLVSGTKERGIADDVIRGGYGDFVLIKGHRFIDIWQAIKPSTLGFKSWPSIPRDVDFKKGTLAALGLPHDNKADIAEAGRKMLSRVKTIKDLDIELVRNVEILIDFVTQDHLEDIGE